MAGRTQAERLQGTLVAPICDGAAPMQKLQGPLAMLTTARGMHVSQQHWHSCLQGLMWTEMSLLKWKCQKRTCSSVADELLQLGKSRSSLVIWQLTRDLELWSSGFK